MLRGPDPTHDLRLTDRVDVGVVAVVLDGSADDPRVLDRAIAKADAHGADLLVGTEVPVRPLRAPRSRAKHVRPRSGGSCSGGVVGVHPPA